LREPRHRRSALDRRTRGPRNAPGKAILLAPDSALETGPGSLLSVGRAGRSCRNPRSPDRSQTLRKWRRGGGVLSEARTRRTSRMVKNNHALFSVRAHRGRGRRRFGGSISRLQWKARIHPVTRQFDVVIERDPEGYYIASVPQFPACHTQARSL